MKEINASLIHNDKTNLTVFSLVSNQNTVSLKLPDDRKVLSIALSIIPGPDWKYSATLNNWYQSENLLTISFTFQGTPSSYYVCVFYTYCNII